MSSVFCLLLSVRKIILVSSFDFMATSLYGFAVDKIFGCAFWTFLFLSGLVHFHSLWTLNSFPAFEWNSCKITSNRWSCQFWLKNVWVYLIFARISITSLYFQLARSLCALLFLSPFYAHLARAHTLSVILIQCVTYFGTDSHRLNVCNGHSLCLKNCYFFSFLGNTKETCFISSFTQQQMCLFFIRFIDVAVCWNDMNHLYWAIMKIKSFVTAIHWVPVFI